MRILRVSHTLGSGGRKNSTRSIGCHGHTGGTRPSQTHQTPKDLSAHESEERGRLKILCFVCGLFQYFIMNQESES